MYLQFFNALRASGSKGELLVSALKIEPTLGKTVFEKDCFDDYTAATVPA